MSVTSPSGSATSTPEPFIKAEHEDALIAQEVFRVSSSPNRHILGNPTFAQLDRPTSQSIEIFDPNDTALDEIDPFSSLLQEETKFEIYRSHESAIDIQYEHETAIQEAKKMLAVLSTLFDSMDLGTLRRNSWGYDMDSLHKFTMPSLIIATVGGTGAGKSTLINALLGDNFLLTNCVRACTSAIVEMVYHAKSTIKAEVHFIPFQQWKDDVQTLHDDASDPLSEADIAQSKMETLFPGFEWKEFADMSIDELLATNPGIRERLGSVETISAANCEELDRKIGRFIDSEREEDGEDAEGASQSSDADNAPLWPLVSKVRIFCKSAVLEAGLIITDLPGTADANAARSAMAAEYMKKAHVILIVAPTTRAVAESAATELLRTVLGTQALNGQYNDNNVLFALTKSEDLTSSEVIKTLKLKKYPEIQSIQAELKRCEDDERQWKLKKTAIDHDIAVSNRCVQLRKETYAKIMGFIAPPRDAETASTAGTKRKRDECPISQMPKRMRREDWELHEQTQSGTGDNDLIGETEGLRKQALEKSEEANAAIVHAQECLLQEQELRVEIMDALNSVHERKSTLQMEKKAFCSLKRAEYSRKVLQKLFRKWFKDLDDSAGERKNPENFDPSINIRNYAEINLDIISTSAIEHNLLTGQSGGDGKATCFTREEETGIPALRRHCSSLPIPSRNRAVESFLVRVKTFALGVHTALVAGDDGGIAADRAMLCKIWESSPDRDDGEGVQTRLNTELDKIVIDQVRGLRDALTNGLEEKCRSAAIKAASVAVETTDRFVASMHGNTLRATIRRNGSWKKGDLNLELCDPYTRRIASSWQRVFERDHFSGLEDAVLMCIKNLVDSIEESASIDLKAKIKHQGELCSEEIKVGLQEIVEVVDDILDVEQKEASRMLAPHIQAQLK